MLHAVVVLVKEANEKYDETTSAYRKTGQYVVKEVLKHTPPPTKRKQRDLFDESENSS